MTRIRRITSVATLVAALGFVVAGPYMVFRGFDAKGQVRAQLKAEHIVTAADSTDPNKPVVDAHTATVQAQIIQKHTLEATGGKSYAELDRTDPARVTSFNGDMLRTALYSSVLAFNVADLVIGLGFFIGGLGLVLALVGVAIRKSETIVLGTAPATLREPVSSTA